MRQKKKLNVEIGERIRLARVAAHVTQERLAEAVEVSPQYISDLERGVVGISVGTLQRVCLALGVTSDSILFPESTVQRDFESRMRMLNTRQAELLRQIITHFLEAVTEE